jgi:hypothetical protein
VDWSAIKLSDVVVVVTLAVAAVGAVSAVVGLVDNLSRARRQRTKVSELQLIFEKLPQTSAQKSALALKIDREVAVLVDLDSVAMRERRTRRSWSLASGLTVSFGVASLIAVAFSPPDSVPASRPSVHSFDWPDALVLAIGLASVIAVAALTFRSQLARKRPRDWIGKPLATDSSARSELLEDE